MVRRVTSKGAGSGRAGYWRGMMEKWRVSGQTPEAFCRQRHLKAGTFGWWRSRLGSSPQGRVSPAGSTSSGFVEVRPSPVTVPVFSPRYEVVLSNGRRIVLAEDFNERVLVRLLRAAEGLGC